MPLLIFQVSGLWQYRHRNWQPVVHATTRTPGPSTVEPVVNECRKPMSPVSRAFLTADSVTAPLWFTRSSNGLLPSSGLAVSGCSALMFFTLRGKSHGRPAREDSRKMRCHDHVVC